MLNVHDRKVRIKFNLKAKQFKIGMADVSCRHLHTVSYLLQENI